MFGMARHLAQMPCFLFLIYGILIDMDELVEKLVVLENKTREFADRL